MAIKNKGVTRIDPAFEAEMKDIAKVRLNKGFARLNPRDLSISEMTRLLRRTDGYRLSLEELKTKPKRK